MADSKVFLADGAKLRCENGGEIRELHSEDRGFSFNGVYFATCQDNIGGKNIPFFEHCLYRKKVFGEDTCVFGKVRWYLTKDNACMGEDLELLTLDSFAVCGQGLAKINPENDGQGVITIESEEEWAKIIQEQLRQLEKEFLNGKNTQERRLEYRTKYMELLRLAINTYHPGEYDRLMSEINTACNDAAATGLESDDPALQKFRDDYTRAISQLAKLLEIYTGVPEEVMTTQTCLESGYGVSDFARYKNNLFGQLDGGVGIDFASRELSIGAYHLSLRVYLVTDEYPKGVYGDLFDYTGDDAFLKWFHDLSNGTTTAKEIDPKYTPAYCTTGAHDGSGKEVPDKGYEGKLKETYEALYVGSEGTPPILVWRRFS